MINVLRKNSKALWAVIAVLCIPFIFYFVQQPDYGAVLQKSELGEVYGHTVTRTELQHNAQLFMLARELGMFTLLQDLIAGAQTDTEAYADFTFNRLIVKHQAQQLGIMPTEDEIVELVKGLRPFRGEKGGFDPAKYDKFSKEVLPSMGFNESNIAELAKDQLILQKLKELVSAGVQVPESEIRENYDRAYGKMTVAVARIRSADFAAGVQPNEEEIAKYFEAHKAELNTEEKRKVSFVNFALSEEQKKLAGKERFEVLQKLADRANEFSQALLEKGANFDQVAARFEVPVQVTGDFTKTTPDPLLNAIPQLTTSAFKLSPEDPNSDTVQGADGFFILHLVNVEPARPLTLEEARPKIVDAIKQERTRELVAAKAAEAAGKIREALKNGAPFDDALKAAGIPMEKLPAFGLADRPKMKPAEEGKPAEPEPEPEDMSVIKSSVVELNAGEVSEFTPTPTGGLIVAVEKREPGDPAMYDAMKLMFQQRVAAGRRETAFADWLHERRREAGVPETVEPAVG